MMDEPDSPKLESSLVDIEGMTLKEFMELPLTPALKAAAERIRQQLDSDIEPVAGFQSGI